MSSLPSRDCFAAAVCNIAHTNLAVAEKHSVAVYARLGRAEHRNVVRFGDFADWGAARSLGLPYLSQIFGRTKVIGNAGHANTVHRMFNREIKMDDIVDRCLLHLGKDHGCPAPTRPSVISTAVELRYVAGRKNLVTRLVVQQCHADLL